MLNWPVKEGCFVRVMGISECLFSVNLLTRDSPRGAEENELMILVERSSCEDKDALITH